MLQRNKSYKALKPSLTSGNIYYFDHPKTHKRTYKFLLNWKEILNNYQFKMPKKYWENLDIKFLNYCTSIIQRKSFKICR